MFDLTSTSVAGRINRDLVLSAADNPGAFVFPRALTEPELRRLVDGIRSCNPGGETLRGFFRRLGLPHPVALESHLDRAYKLVGPGRFVLLHEVC